MSDTTNDDFNDSDVAALSGLYALDALDEFDSARFEAYLAVHADARTEVEGFRRTTDRLASISERPAPAGIRASVLGSLGDVRQDPPRIDIERRRRRVDATRRIVAIAAGLLLVAAVGVGGFALGSTDDGSPVSTDEVAAILVNDDARVVELNGEGDVSARVVYSSSANEVAVLTDDLEPLGDDETYQLWQLSGAEAVPAGLFTPGEDGTVRAALPGDVAAADAIAVTVEPAGGSATPTLPIVMSGELV